MIMFQSNSPTQSNINKKSMNMNFSGVFIVTIIVIVCQFVTLAEANALTYKLSPYENACFYETVTEVNKKIQFYYAVRVNGSILY